MSQQTSLSSVFQKLDGSICKIHEISKGDLATIYIATSRESLLATYQLSDNGTACRIADFDDKRVFAVASLFKPLIAMGVARMIDNLSISPKEEHKRYHRLRDAWEMTFTEIFNDFSNVEIKHLKGDPTIKQLMGHFKGAHNMNHILLAPDGSPLISEDDFRDIISQFTEHTSSKHSRGQVWVKYSNGNFVLLALLIQVVSKMTLWEFLREYIFEPLEMNDTYMTADKLNNLTDGLLAKPHTVSGDGTRHLISFDRVPYLADTVELVVAGGHTTAADYGRFFKALSRALNDENPRPSWLNKTFAKFLLKPLSEIDGQGNGYAACGFVTTLHECWPGSHSLNRLISPKSQYHDYVLGKYHNRKEYTAQYIAGSATGWASTAYFLPDQDLSIIVLSNISGPLDATDLISRLCLSELLDLQPAQYVKDKLKPTFLGPPTTPQDERTRVHYVELARLIYGENVEAYRQLERVDSQPDALVSGRPDIHGTFTNSNTGQSLHVSEIEGVLCVKMVGSKTSELMRFVWTGKAFRTCSHPKGHVSISQVIESFGAWKNQEFRFEQTARLGACLVRDGLDCVDQYVRTG